ncbi:uncharacterized protein LOC128883154 isoform X2 [Hylaeus volcanicus]|uniref:uncharacterized protein LOC128883154 isoform X2 n=1 Tax=Hylaeus volcanicus TaxID=313075 RepID=UPI0023B774BD|nr:uncharacterized protein LOC128883154 isoform X2 [Hylaeus volcanicus]
MKKMLELSDSQFSNQFKSHSKNQLKKYFETTTSGEECNAKNSDAIFENHECETSQSKKLFDAFFLLPENNQNAQQKHTKCLPFSKKCDSLEQASNNLFPSDNLFHNNKTDELDDHSREMQLQRGENSPLFSCHGGDTNNSLQSSVSDSRSMLPSQSPLIPCFMVIQKLYFTGVPELLLLRDIMYPLQGIDGTYIKYHSGSNSFLVRQNIVVSTPVRVLVSRCCKIGCYYRCIRHHLEPTDSFKDIACVKNLSSSNLTSSQHIIQPPLTSLLHQSLQQFVHKHLSIYYKMLAYIENEIVRAGNQPYGQTFSLRKLLLYLQKPTEKIALLASIIQATQYIKGGPLLSVVFDNSNNGDTEKKALMNNMLEELQNPWLDMVYQWVTNGVLMDPCDEFFIKIHLNGASVSHPTSIDEMKEPCTPCDASLTLDPLFYWKYGHNVRLHLLPVYVSNELTFKIVYAGKAVALAKCFMFLESTFQKTTNVFDSSSRIIDIQKQVLCRDDTVSKHCEEPLFQVPLADISNTDICRTDHDKHSLMLQHLAGKQLDSTSIVRHTLGSLSDFSELRYTKSLSKQQTTPLESTFQSFLDMEKMVHRLYFHNSNVIVNLLLYRYHLLQHCEAIRCFLFLSQGDLIYELLTLFHGSFTGSSSPYNSTPHNLSRHLVNSTASFKGCSLAEPAQHLTLHDLRCCLDVAIASSNAQHLTQEVLDRFEVTKLRNTRLHYNPSGWEVVTFNYIVCQNPVSLILDEKSMQRYRQIHSMLWRTQRVAYSLNLLWQNHIRTCRRGILSSLPFFEKREKASSEPVNEFYLDVHWALSKCESLYAETSHFMRNIQSFFIDGVIEPSWKQFVQNLYQLVTQAEQSPCSRMSQVDLMIECHQNYLNDMLTGLFLSDVQGVNVESNNESASSTMNSHAFTTLDLLRHSCSTYEMDEEFSVLKEPSFPNATLELILKLENSILTFINLSNDIFLSLYNYKPPRIDATKLNSLEHISQKFRGFLIDFLKRINSYSRLTAQEHFICRGNSTVHQDALRELLYRLDFNNYYGSDWELYRHPVVRPVSKDSHLLLPLNGQTISESVKPSIDKTLYPLHISLRGDLHQEPFHEDNSIVTANLTKSLHDSNNFSMNTSTSTPFNNDTKPSCSVQSAFLKKKCDKNKKTMCNEQQNVRSRRKNNAEFTTHLKSFPYTNSKTYDLNLTKAAPWKRSKDIDENKTNSLEYSSFIDSDDAATKEINYAEKVYTVSDNAEPLETSIGSDYEHFNKHLHQFKDTTPASQESHTDDISQLYEHFESSHESQHEENKLCSGDENISSFSSQSYSCHSMDKDTETSHTECHRKLGSINQKTFNRLMRMDHDDVDLIKYHTIHKDGNSYSSEDTNELWMYLPEDHYEETVYSNSHSPYSHNKKIISPKNAPTRRSLKSHNHSFFGKGSRNRIQD